MKTSAWNVKRSREIMAGLCALALAAGLGACSSSSPPSSSTKASSYTVGLDEWTQIPSAFEWYADGLQVGIDEINASGGANGHKINLIVKDDATASTSSVVSYWDEFQAAHADAVIYLDIAGEPSLIALAQRDKTALLLGLVADHDVISPTTPYVYTTTPDFQQVIEAEAYFAVKHGYKKLGVMEQQQYAGAETALATAYVKSHFGASIVTYQYSPPTGTDQTAQLQALKSLGVQAVLSYESPSGTLLEAQEEKTVVYNVPIFDNQCSTDTHASLNKLGVTTTCATFVQANSSVPAYESEIAAAQRFGFASIAKDEADAFVNGYLAADVLAQAGKKCGANCTPAQFNSALQNISNFSTGGLTSPITFSASQHNMLSTVYPWTLQSDGTQTTGTGIVVAP